MMLVHAHHGRDLDGKPFTAGVSLRGDVAAIAGDEVARLSPDAAERLAAWLIVSAVAGRARFAGEVAAPVLADADGIASALDRVAAAAGEALAMVGDVGAAGDVAPVSPYEAACARFDAASANYPKAKAEAKRILRAAESEYDAATANLRRYESAPGIARPEAAEVGGNGPDEPQ